MKKDNNIMKGQGEDGKWITVNGTHVFVEEGQSVEDAMNSKFDKKSRADEDLTKRAEALHKTMKEAGLPVKKSIEETKAIMRNLDKMPDYGDEDTETHNDQVQEKTGKSGSGILVGSERDSDVERERLETHLGALGRNTETFYNKEYGKIYVKVDRHPQYWSYSGKKHFIFWTDNGHEGAVNNYAEHLTFNELYRRLKLCRAEYQ